MTNDDVAAESLELFSEGAGQGLADDGVGRRSAHAGEGVPGRPSWANITRLCRGHERRAILRFLLAVLGATEIT